MIRKVPFEPRHFRDLTRRDTSGFFGENEYLSFMKMATDESYACVDSKNEAVAVFGAHRIHSDRVETWFVSFTKNLTESLSVFRIMKKTIFESPVTRIECAVALDNAQGHKLVQKLGFKKECERLRAYLPNGYDAALYSIVKA